MARQERARTNPRKRNLLVAGVLRMPSSILSWERDLLEPALTAVTKGSRQAENAPAEGKAEDDAGD